jgi:3-phosphoglycerate kinase
VQNAEAAAGGGDTVTAPNHAGAADRYTYISTAGGAFLEWLEGKVLPGAEILRAKSSASPQVWQDTRVSSGVK